MGIRLQQICKLMVSARRAACRSCASFASAEEVDDSAWSGESVALGWGEADVECGFESIAELDQVKRVASKVTDKGGVEANL